MILIGELEALAAEYRASWSGLCRGKARGTFSSDAEGRLVLRSDFVRWLGRRAVKNKEEKMVLVHREERPGRTVLIFEGSDEGKTVEQILAEVICRLAPNGGPVDSWAIHFCSLRHPFSTTQRLREMTPAFNKWWMGEYLEQNKSNFLSHGILKGSDDYAYHFVKREFKYYFSPHFVTWLRHEYLDKEPDRVPDR